jgi:hypothetical protein
VLELSKIVICNFETGALEFIGKEVHKRKRLNELALCDRPAHLSSAEPSSVGNGPWQRVPASAHGDATVARPPPATSHQRCCPTTATYRPCAPRSPSPLSSRTSLKGRYFLLSLAKLSPSPSRSVTPLRPLSAVYPRRQLPLMNRVKHCPCAPQSHANLAMTRATAP